MPLNKDVIFRKIKTARWDLIIIGGSITGAAILREAVRRKFNSRRWNSGISPGAPPAAPASWCMAACAI